MRRDRRNRQPRRGPTIPPDKARELLAAHIREAQELLAQVRVGEDAFEVWNSATRNIMKAAFGQGESIVYEVTEAGALDRFLAPGEELPEDHYRQRLLKAIPRIEGAIRQLELGLAPPLDERAAPAPVTNPAQAPGPEPEWDVFVSYATEDREPFVTALVAALTREGLRVWYDQFELRLGDSLRQSIERGLARSRHGVVVISPRFLAKDWPKRELDGMAAREVNGRKVILPIWHDLDAAAVRERSPMLADRVAVSSGRGLAEVVRAILAAVRPEADEMAP